MTLSTRFIARLALSASCALAIGACTKSSDQSEAEATSATTTAKPAAATTSVKATAAADPSTKAAGADKRMFKEFSAAPDGKLGTVASGLGLAIGSPVPDVSIPDDQGNPVSLTDLAARRGALLVVFYRGGWCPYCNTQIRHLATTYAEFSSRNVTPVLISVDKADKTAKTRATFEVAFPLLSDSELVAHEAFNVVQVVDADTREKYKRYGINLAEHSGRDHHTIAVPSIFLFDKAGSLVWAHADPDYTVRPKTDQLIAVIDGNLKR